MKTLTTISLALAMFTTAAYAGDAKAPADKKAPDAGKPADKPAAMEAPKPPQEVADMAKSIAGTWKCTGKAQMGPGAPVDFTASITQKLDLDKWWIQGSLATTGKVPFKFTEYTGYDPVGKKWHRMGVDNMGGGRTMEASGMTDGKMVWEGTGMEMGQMVKLRDTEEVMKDKSFHTLGEESTDGGKTWKMGHDATCKK